MAAEHEAAFTAENVDTLQELMNIAFGQAASDLSEVMALHVELSVPQIAILPAVGMPAYIRAEVGEADAVSIVEQSFEGEFRGGAFLVMPDLASEKMAALFGVAGGTECGAGELPDVIEGETLMEVGNIIIGACVGKLAELLASAVTYTPPSVMVKHRPSEAIPDHLFAPGYSAVVMRTVFAFSAAEVRGFLFLVTSRQSMGWLKAALERFLAQYE